MNVDQIRASIYDFEIGPRVPADVQEAIEAARALLKVSGCPPRGADGAHQVLVVLVVRDGFDVRLCPFGRALEDLDDPEVQGVLRRSAEQLVAVPNAVVLLAMNRDGHYWCGPVGELTGAAEGVDD